MNSLSYLSRQFDVLVSSSAPSTPPSTPTAERQQSEFDSNKRYNTPPLKRIRTWASARTFFFPLDDQAGRPYDTHQARQRKRSGSTPNSPHPYLQLHKAGETSRTPQTDRGAEVETRAGEAVATTTNPRLEYLSLRKHPSDERQGEMSSWSNQFVYIRMLVIFARWCSAMWYGLTRPLWISLQRQESVRIRSRSRARIDDDERDVYSQSDTSFVRSRVSSLMRWVLQPQRRPPTPTPISQRTDTPPPTVNLIPPDISESIDDARSPPSVCSDTTSTLSPHPSLLSTASLTPPSTPPRVRPTHQSRHASPGTKRTPLHQRKTLVLDLDETLIHSTTKPLFHSRSKSGFFGNLIGFGRNRKAGHMVEVVMNGRRTLYHVYKRPFVDYFLRKVSAWYTLVIFTASMKEYADPVIDWLDAGRGMFGSRFFREHCTQLPNGSYSKDLTVLNEDLARICLVDNSPVSYNINKANGIPIEGWTHDPYDEALLDLLPVLDSLRFTNDVRHVLGLRGF